MNNLIPNFKKIKIKIFIIKIQSYVLYTLHTTCPNIIILLNFGKKNLKY